MSFKEIIKKDIEAGYIDEDGEPLKCYNCESERLEDTDEIVEELGSHCITEFKRVCKNCQKTVGHWAYGYWQL